MLTPQVAFALAYAPARLAALHSQQTLLAELARDPAVAGDEKLAQAVSFGSKALSIELGLAKRKLDEVLATAHGAGMPLFRAPIDEPGWPKFNAATEESVGRVGTATTGLAYRLGKRARDLYTVWARAQRLAYLRQSAANHPALLEAAGQVVAEAAQAWTGLASELRGAASIEKRRERLQKWMDVAAKPDAVTSTHHGAGAFGEITDWLKTLDMLLEGIVKDVPGAGPAPAGAPPPVGGPMKVSEFIQQATALAASGKLTTLKLEGAGGHVAEIAKVSELAQVVTLDLRNQGITDADIEALAASPYVSGLRLLRLDENKIGQAGIDALAAASSKTMKSLEGVGFDLNQVRNPADRFELYDERNRERIATKEGEALEAKYGRIAWLHPPDPS